MARGDLLCPICNAVLGLPNWQYRGGNDVADVTGHAHLTFVGTFACNNGHRWRVGEGSGVVMDRVS